MKKIEINIMLENLTSKTNSMPLSNLMNDKEIKLLEEAQSKGDSNLNVFMNLLDHAELEASREKMFVKRLLWLFGRRGVIFLHIYDENSVKLFDMKFIFPINLFRLITEKPLQELLQKENPPPKVPKILWDRLKCDLRVFKIVFICNNKFLNNFRLIDICTLGSVTE